MNDTGNGRIGSNPVGSEAAVRLPRPLLVAIAFWTLVGIAGPSAAQEYQFTTFDVPGAQATLLYGINERGDIVGRYSEGGVWAGFLLTADGLVRIAKPGATATYTNGINERGDIAGHYVVSGRAHGFVLRDGVFTDVEVPGALATRIWDITSNGRVAGEYQDPTTNAWRGMTWRGGTFSYFDVPGSNMTAGFGINARGTVVGHFTKPTGSKMFGFVFSEGQVIEVNNTASGPNMSCLLGINANGEAVGHYLDAQEGVVYGYVYRNGVFKGLQMPGARHTYPNKISQDGTIVGYYYATDGTVHGFIATPLNPAGNLTGR